MPCFLYITLSVTCQALTSLKAKIQFLCLAYGWHLINAEMTIPFKLIQNKLARVPGLILIVKWIVGAMRWLSG